MVRRLNQLPNDEAALGLLAWAASTDYDPQKLAGIARDVLEQNGGHGRVEGMARQQARSVHGGVAYDVEVDTTYRSTEECVRDIAGQLSLEAFIR